MDALELFTLLGFGWLYDRVEERHGRGAALFVTVVGATAIIAAFVFLLALLLR